MLARTLTVSSIALAMTITAATTASVQLAEWTFESSVPTTAGPHAAEGGLFAGSSFATGSHASQAVVYSNPVGNGSFESFSSNNWGVGDFYQFQTSTAGYESISFQWDQTRSGTGPANFEVQWSIDGMNFMTLMNYEVTQVSWSSGSYNPASTFGAILLPTDADDESNIYVRLVNLSEVGTGGTNRVDNIIFTGRLVPGPGALALLGLCGLVAGRRRR